MPGASPPPAHPARPRSLVFRWQVSWLADPAQPVGLPGQATQWPCDEPLSAYSCGGSRGVEASPPRTTFPFHPPAIWRDHRNCPNRLGTSPRQKRKSSLLTLVLGGARSGKSRQAEALVTSLPGPWTYIATGEARDAEMAARIAAHRAARAAGWDTVEAPLDLPGALAQAGVQPALVDCLTLWLTNLMLAEHDLAGAQDSLLAALAARPAPTVLVGNEVGLGIVPENPLARAFRDAAGRLHQALAARADRVLFMVAGLPLTVKG